MAAFESEVGWVWRDGVHYSLLSGRKAPVHHPRCCGRQRSHVPLGNCGQGSCLQHLRFHLESFDCKNDQNLQFKSDHNLNN